MWSISQQFVTSSRGPNALCWPLRTRVHKCVAKWQTHLNNNKKIKNKKKTENKTHSYMRFKKEASKMPQWVRNLPPTWPPSSPMSFQATQKLWDGGPQSFNKETPATTPLSLTQSYPCWFYSSFESLCLSQKTWAFPFTQRLPHFPATPGMTWLIMTKIQTT